MVNIFLYINEILNYYYYYSSRKSKVLTKYCRIKTRGRSMTSTEWRVSKEELEEPEAWTTSSACSWEEE